MSVCLIVSYICSPLCPNAIDWGEYYPTFCKPHEDDEPPAKKQRTPVVEFADIGCGYGGLLGMVHCLLMHSVLAFVLDIN